MAGSGAASNAGDVKEGGGGHGGSEARVRVFKGKNQGREEREKQGAGCSTYPPWGPGHRRRGGGHGGHGASGIPGTTVKRES